VHEFKSGAAEPCGVVGLRLGRHEVQIALDAKPEFVADVFQFAKAHIAELLGPSMALALRARLRRFKTAVPF
jgi:hypothetical protein